MTETIVVLDAISEAVAGRLRTLLPDEVECFVTASNETMILGVVVFIGRRV